MSAMKNMKGGIVDNFLGRIIGMIIVIALIAGIIMVVLRMLKVL